MQFLLAAAAAAKLLQSCLTLCDPIDSSPPGSPVPGILQDQGNHYYGLRSSPVALFILHWTVFNSATM